MPSVVDERDMARLPPSVSVQESPALPPGSPFSPHASPDSPQGPGGRIASHLISVYDARKADAVANIRTQLPRPGGRQGRLRVFPSQAGGSQVQCYQLNGSVILSVKK